MEIKISLQEYADVAFIKKLLSQIKDIKSIEISNESSANDTKLEELLERSKNQIDEGKFVEHSDELINSFFKE